MKTCVQIAIWKILCALCKKYVVYVSMMLAGCPSSSRRAAQERGDVDGPPRGRSGLSYNKLQPWSPEPDWGGHVTGDAAPKAAVAQRGERSEQDHQSTRPLLYLFKGQHSLVLNLFDFVH